MSEPAIPVQPYSFLLYSLHSCLNFPVHPANFNSDACFTSSLLPLRVCLFSFYASSHMEFSNHMRLLKDCNVLICVGLFFNYIYCSRLATQNNNITFPTLYMYFVSKPQLLKELSLTLHLAGESITTWHNRFFLK